MMMILRVTYKETEGTDSMHDAAICAGRCYRPRSRMQVSTTNESCIATVSKEGFMHVVLEQAIYFTRLYLGDTVR